MAFHEKPDKKVGKTEWKRQVEKVADKNNSITQSDKHFYLQEIFCWQCLVFMKELLVETKQQSI